MFKDGFIFNRPCYHDFLLLNGGVGFHLIIDFSHVDFGVFAIRPFDATGFTVRRFDLLMDGSQPRF